MAKITDPEKKELFTLIKHELGAPVVKFELKDEQMDSLLKTSIKEYAFEIQNWLIDNQWSALVGKNISEADIAKAFITRTLDFETQFTYAYSKIVGLQANGPWELKKDYVSLVPNQQIYEIPANRELNEILWITPPDIVASTIDPYIGGFANSMGYDYGYMSQFYVSPAYDILARSTDRNLKSRLLRSELVYKITAAPDGKKFLHLMPVPGGRFDYGVTTFNQWKCWYWYYDVNPENRNECINANQDIIKLPSDVPLEKLDYSNLNESARYWVQRFLTAKCKYTIGYQRAKTGGVIKVAESEITMEYSELLSDAKEEKEKLIIDLREQLNKMTNENMLIRKGNEAENLNRSLKYRPFTNPIQFI